MHTDGLTVGLLISQRCRGHTVTLFCLPTVNGNPNGAKRLGAFALGSFTPLSGYAFGPGRNDVTLTADNKVTNANPNTNGAVFWPASGFRYSGDNGAVQWIGAYGHSWSSTASTPDYGHFLEVGSTTITPQYNSFRTYAFPVRCIRCRGHAEMEVYSARWRRHTGVGLQCETAYIQQAA